jgi:hypothetical protein
MDTCLMLIFEKIQLQKHVNGVRSRSMALGRGFCLGAEKKDATLREMLDCPKGVRHAAKRQSHHHGLGAFLRVGRVYDIMCKRGTTLVE